MVLKIRFSIEKKEKKSRFFFLWICLQNNGNVKIAVEMYFQILTNFNLYEYYPPRDRKQQNQNLPFLFTRVKNKELRIKEIK